MNLLYLNPTDRLLLWSHRMRLPWQQSDMPFVFAHGFCWNRISSNWTVAEHPHQRDRSDTHTSDHSRKHRLASALRKISRSRRVSDYETSPATYYVRHLWQPRESSHRRACRIFLLLPLSSYPAEPSHPCLHENGRWVSGPLPAGQVDRSGCVGVTLRRALQQSYRKPELHAAYPDNSQGCRQDRYWLWTQHIRDFPWPSYTA